MASEIPRALNSPGLARPYFSRCLFIATLDWKTKRKRDYSRRSLWFGGETVSSTELGRENYFTHLTERLVLVIHSWWSKFSTQRPNTTFLNKVWIFETGDLGQIDSKLTPLAKIKNLTRYLAIKPITCYTLIVALDPEKQFLISFKIEPRKLKMCGYSMWSWEL